jgi:hypothetical protein
VIRAKSWERTFRRAARLELKSTKKQWKEYKERRTSWRESLTARDAGLLFWLYIPGLIIAYADHPQNVLVLLIAVYCTGTVIVRSADLQQRLHGSVERYVTVHFPMADIAFARWQVREFLRKSLFLLAMLLLVFGAIGFYRNIGWWMVPVFGISQWVLTMTGVALCSLLWPTLNRLWGYGIHISMLIIPTVASVYSVPFLWAAVTPLGWVPALYGSLLITKDQWGPLLILPATAAVATCPWAFRRVIQQYESESGEIVSLNVAESEALEETDALLDPAQRSVRDRFVAQRMESGLLADGFAAPHFQGRGWIERLVFTYLVKGRGHAVAEFMFAAEPDAWSTKWRTALLITVGASSLAFFLQSAWPAWLGLVAVAATATPMVGGYWPGFSPTADSTMHRPIYATYPIGYQEISQLMLKVHLTRIILSLPFLPFLAILTARAYGASAGFGMVAGLVCMYFYLAVQPLYVALWFSKGTNDSQSYNWQKQAMKFLAVSAVFAILGLAVAMFVLSLGRFFWAWAFLMAILPMVTSLLWWVYSCFHDRGRVDLLKVPTQ